MPIAIHQKKDTYRQRWDGAGLWWSACDPWANHARSLKEVPKGLLLLLLCDGIMLTAKSMSITVHYPKEVAICNSSPYFRNIADMRIECENADLKRWRIWGCGPSELDFRTFGTLSWIHIRICRDQLSLAYAEVDSDQKLYRVGSKINPKPHWLPFIRILHWVWASSLTLRQVVMAGREPREQHYHGSEIRDKYTLTHTI